METEERKLKRMQSILSPREKELERLKSLAVVSVLNKNFEEKRPTSLLVNISPSSSLTTSDSNRLRSNSTSSKSTIDTFSKVSAEKELEEDHLVTNSPIDAEKEDLERRTSELETLYAASINDMNALKLQNDQQIELLRLQDKLILQLTEELDESKSAPPPQQQSNIDLNSAQTNVAEMMKELQELRDWKSSVESGLSTLITQLEADDEKLHALEKEADQVKKTNTAQTEYIDTKVQTLLTQVLHKNEMINKLQQENEAQEKALAEKSSSARSSGRWRGSLIPPASPPPSLPLPPIPTESSRSILSELSKGIEIETALDEAAYYKEFTDQLQERLSISKEIDDLRVWEPSDFDEIQKKIDSETWSLDSDQQRTFWKGVKKRLIK